MGVLMKPMDLAWSLLKADPHYRVRDPKASAFYEMKQSQAMHPAIAGHVHRRLNPVVNTLNRVPSPFGEQTINPASRIPRNKLKFQPQKFTDMPSDKNARMFGSGPMVQLPTGMDTRNYGDGSEAGILGDKDPGVSVSNRSDSTPDAVLNLLQIPGAAPSPMNYFQTDFRPSEPQEYGQMSPRDSEAFEEVFNRFMEQQGRRGNPDNVQMLPGNVMQQM
jgi:hypothetical protein